VYGDAIKDCSMRGSLVLDPFCGSGTILIAAEKSGRRARAIELDPTYVDVAIRRWEQYTGKTARLAPMGETFDELAVRFRFPSRLALGLKVKGT
jgi:DNA modification methylase